MKKFMALLKVSVQSMLLTTTGQSRSGKKRKISGISAAALLAFIGLYLSVLYSMMLLDVLVPLHMEVLIFVYLGLGALIGGLLYTVFAVKGVVFGGRDNDLLLSLPVSSTMLMLSRVLAIYLENLCFAFFVIVPAGVCCAIRVGGYDALFWVRLVLAAILLPLLDTALSVLVGALVAFSSSRLPGEKILQNLFTGAFLVVVFSFSFNLNGILSGLAANAGSLRDKLTWAMPMLWMGDGILSDWTAFLFFALCCIIPFVLMTVILGKCFRRAVTSFQSRSARSDYRLSAQNAKGQSRALLRKECNRFFGTPSYLWNAGLGLMLLIAAGIAVIVKGDSLTPMLEMIPGLPIAAGVMGFCLCTCIITAPSISLEGKNFWILREAPIREKTLLRIKVGFQLLLSIPCTIFCGACIAGVLLTPREGICLTVIMCVFAVGQACFGMLMGLAFPKLDAANDTMVIKQSLASLLAMFLPMLVLVLAGMLYAFVGLWLGILVIVVFALACVVILDRRGPEVMKSL